jgi:hypothetical protein
MHRHVGEAQLLLGDGRGSSIMRKYLLALAAIALVTASGTSDAVWYMVNGRAATYAEMQFLIASRVPSGSYWVDAKGNLTRAAPSGYRR